MIPCPRRLLPILGLASTALWGSAPRALSAQVAPAAHADTLQVSVGFGHTRFGGFQDPWTEGSVSVTGIADPGALVARLNRARRYGAEGTQVEFDLYPKLGGERYGYLNLGWSGSSAFPHHRYGAELFTSLTGPWEASAGVRHLRFRTTHVTLYTGSLGVYRGNWWFSVRPFVTPDAGDASVSATFSARRYGRDRFDYWGLAFGVGASAAEFTTAQDLVRRSSVTVGASGRRPLGDGRWNLAWGVSWEREELPSDRVRRRLGADLGLTFTVSG
jgi:YaiO family outer membrane protein